MASGYKSQSLPTLAPEQMDLLRRLIGGSIPGLEKGLGSLTQLAGGGNEDYWKQLEAPAFRQFGRLQGDIASRFSGGGGGAGAMSARRGSGFFNEQNSAAMEFAESLQSQRLGLQSHAIEQLLGLSNTLLGTQTRENVMIPPRQKGPGFGSAFGSALGGLGSLFGAKKFGIF